MISNADLQTLVMAALDRCLVMQAEHLEGLRSGSLTKINQWLEERQLMVGRLRQVLTEAQESGVSPDVRDILLEKLGSILEGEKILSSVASKQRSRLCETISSLRRGKKAVAGYSMMPTPGPQFVSHNR